MGQGKVAHGKAWWRKGAMRFKAGQDGTECARRETIAQLGQGMTKLRDARHNENFTLRTFLALFSCPILS